MDPCFKTMPEFQDIIAFVISFFFFGASPGVSKSHDVVFFKVECCSASI